MKISYYPGCSLESTAKSYDISAQKVCKHLGLELEEIPDWCCCGSSPALKMDRMLSTSLAAKNLAQAEKQNLSQLLIPCPFCFRRLLSAQQEITSDELLKKKVEEILETRVEGNLDIQSLLGFMRNAVGIESIRNRVTKPLSDLKVLPYYGCYLVKPKKITQFDDPENPVSMDEVLRALGAEVLDWDFKTECCGAGLSISKTEHVVQLVSRLIREAVWRGADAIVVACQLCQANLDMRQREIGKADGKNYAIPIIYFTQAMGLAFGFQYDELGLQYHLVNPKPSLRKKGIVE
jgi:heterodisulfide reductase subunit B